MSTPVIFQYDQLDQETRVALRARADEVRDQVKKTAKGIVQIGASLHDAQSRLAKPGAGWFQAWIMLEFGWGISTAYNFIHVYERFGDYANFAQMDIAVSALYELARPSTPAAAVEEAVQRAEAGERLTHTIVKAIVNEHRPIALDSIVLYLGQRYRVTGTTPSSVWMRNVDTGKREVAPVNDVEVIELPGEARARSYHPADSEQNPILETHPHFGALLTNTAVCPACGEIHAQWKPMAGGFWLCPKCNTETPDDAMTPYTRQDADAEARMERRRAPSKGTVVGIPSDPPKNVQHSSESNEWCTPEPYIEAARTVMGSIDLDPASCALANQIVRATNYYTIDHDGLARGWYGNAWLNAPYGKTGNESNQGIWAARLIRAWEEREIQSAIMLCNASTGAEWFQPLWRFPICFTDHRIVFYNEHGPQDSPTHYNCFVYFGHEFERFYEHFVPFGRVIIPQELFSLALP